jgi:hypothetical protein
MCDYSLAGLRTRLAIVGEELVTHRFPTGSLGLTTPAELELHRPGNGWWPTIDPTQVACAVCIPHGSRLSLRDIPERLQQRLGIGAAEEVVFIQMSAEHGTLSGCRAILKRPGNSAATVGRGSARTRSVLANRRFGGRTR